MFAKLRAIAWFTALETLGHPATLLLTLAAVAGTLALPLFQFQRFSEDGRLARDCGLAMALLFGAFLAIGGASRLRRALTDGTSAIALVKPLSRGLWLCGHALGGALALTVFLLAQGAAAMVAEAFSPRYHTTGRYADVGGILMALGVVAGVLVVAALNNRFRSARFPLSSMVLLPVGLWGVVMFLPAPHWGDLTALAAVAMLLAQVLTFAVALAVCCSPGVLAGVTLAGLGGAMIFLGVSAYLPLDALSGGGAVPMAQLLLLLPQACLASAFFLWCGVRLLAAKECV